MVLIIAAGITTVVKRARKPAGKPNNTNADVKKINPDATVPIKVKIPEVNLVLNRFTSKNNPKNIKAVMGLSSMLGICPLGNVVVSAEIKPVLNPTKRTYLRFGNNTIARNIISSVISGFIVKIAGTTPLSTAPIPTNKEIVTKILVFISHLSSSYTSLFFSPNSARVPVAKKYVHYNSEQLW